MGEGIENSEAQSTEHSIQNIDQYLENFDRYNNKLKPQRESYSKTVELLKENNFDLELITRLENIIAAIDLEMAEMDKKSKAYMLSRTEEEWDEVGKAVQLYKKRLG
jgi:hypothetical protein